MKSSPHKVASPSFRKVRRNICWLLAFPETSADSPWPSRWPGGGQNVRWPLRPGLCRHFPAPLWSGCLQWRCLVSPPFAVLPESWETEVNISLCVYVFWKALLSHHDYFQRLLRWLAGFSRLSQYDNVEISNLSLELYKHLQSESLERSDACFFTFSWYTILASPTDSPWGSVPCRGCSSWWSHCPPQGSVLDYCMGEQTASVQRTMGTLEHTTEITAWGERLEC